jgi:tetratricopeptide (TPR) repeat protein
MMKRLKLISPLGAILLVAVLASAVSPAELTDQEREEGLREARELVKAGRQKTAIRKLDDLHKRSPDNPMIVKELFRVLVDTDEYTRAEQMITAYLERRPHDARAMADLAGLYFKTERVAEGRATLDRIVREEPDQHWPYELAIEALSRHKLEDELLVLIAEAREALTDSTVFAVNAGKIHMGAGRYQVATREFLLAATSEGRSRTSASGTILVMAANDEARPGVIKSLEAARSIESLAQVARETLWEVYIADGNCARSLAELATLIVDDKSFSKFLPELARLTVNAGCYKECAEAYSLAVKHSGDRSKIPSLLFEKGACESKGGSTEQAISTYDGIIEKYGDTVWGSKASTARGRIYRGLGDLETAVQAADVAMAARQAGDERFVAILFKADCLIDMGRLDESLETYDLVEMAWGPAYAQEAFFNLGEVNFYKAGFDDALSYYNVTLRQFPDQPRANDAIDRLLLLKASKTGNAYSPDLEEFAAADLLRRQGKTVEAGARFEQLARSGGESIKVESLKSLAKIYLEEGAFDSAVKTYTVIGESLDTYFSPAALEAVGDIYHELGRTDEAISAYENLILLFPGSVSAGEARRKIELVRRESTESS